VQGEIDRGSNANLDTALYWLDAAVLRIDNILASLSTNSDASARTLAKSLLASSEGLPAVDSSHLQPLPREFGKDLTSGKIVRRAREIELNMSVPDADAHNAAK
jgi:hypothetical protein